MEGVEGELCRTERCRRERAKPEMGGKTEGGGQLSRHAAEN